MKYDLFYVSTGTIDEQDWKSFKSRFPNAQKIENANSIDDVKKKSFTKLFWLVWSDLVIRNDFDFTYEATKWDLEYVHVFKNGNHFNGVCLFPKTTTITSKEFKYRFFINKKEIDIVASDPKSVGANFDIIFISYNEPNADENWHNLKSRFPRAQRVSGVKGIHQAHIEAAKRVKSEMFWVVDADAKIVDTFNFDYADPEKHTVHVWQSLNPINGLVYGYGGVKLLPTQMTIDMDLTKPDMTTSISNLFKPVERISNVTVFNTDPFTTWRSAFRECCKLASRVIDRQNEEETQKRLDTWCSVGNEYATGGAQAGRAYGEKNKTDLAALKKINDFEWLQEQFNGR